MIKPSHDVDTNVERPLDGVLVLEFAHLIAGPSAGLALADLGARVIKIEPPAGDRSRRLVASGEGSFPAWNGSKESLCLDLKNPDDHRTALALIERADVVVESFRAGAMERLGLGYEELAKKFPKLVYASLTGFGSDAPDPARPAVDAIVQAETGMLSVTGEADREPVKVGFQVVDTAAGLALGQAILAQLIYRWRTGRGGHVEVSLFDVGVHLQAHLICGYSMSGNVPERSGNIVRHGYPTDVFDTADGSIMVAAYFEDHWQALCVELGLSFLVHDKRFATNALRSANLEALRPLLAAAFSTDSTASWMARLEQRKLISGVVKDYAEITADFAAGRNAALVQVHDPGMGRDYLTVRQPYRSSSWRSRPRTPAPWAVGQDTDAIEVELGIR